MHSATASISPLLSAPHGTALAAVSPACILVIRGGAIGDFVLTLPVLAVLRQRYPHARLVVLGHPHIAQLAQAGGLVDEVRSISLRALTPFFVRGEELAPESASFFARFDLIVSYLYDPDGAFHENLARCSGAHLISGPQRPDETLPLHATQSYLQPLEQLGIVGADPVPRLHVGSPARRRRESGTTPPTLALHPGSGSQRKNWPEAKWGELISHLLDETSLDLLLVGGEAEGPRLDRLAAGRPRWRLRLARNLPLADLARRLADCTAFVGHDSGISHLASALGLPGIVLWGESVEAVWRPRGERCVLLRDPRGLAELPVWRVLEALRWPTEGAGTPPGLGLGSEAGARLDPAPPRASDRR